ncbi:hypothetical protein TNCV_4374751 [Trichonephila clavipes]|uniref:Uncharacterized protein n=1 Tax=Trichonephila clavipes TaxID=2585209 RepID=A0A8X6W2D6_TRICX|nr:hypothetical protein TNCV_4374751 [Trichonephila clavipes]
MRGYGSGRLVLGVYDGGQMGPDFFGDVEPPDEPTARALSMHQRDAGVYRRKDMFHHGRAAYFFGGAATYTTTELSSGNDSKGAYVLTPARFIKPINNWGVSEDFPALENAIDRCAVTLRWFRTNEKKLSGQGKESALEFGSKEDAK